MTQKSIVPLRMAGLFGVLSPVIAFTCIGLAISYSSWFTWTGNWLSDLGGKVGETPIWAARGISSILFNFGLIIAGILGILFVVGLIKSNMLGMGLGRLGSIILVLNMVALCAIGIFPETTGDPHTLVSLCFFFLVPLSLLSVGVKIRKSSENTLGLPIIVLGILSLAIFPFLFIPQPWGSNAIIEMFPSVAISIFAVIYGAKLFMQAPKVVEGFGK